MTLAKLREMWAAALAKAESIRAAATDRLMTDEERTNLTAELTNIDRLASEITIAEDLEQRRAAADATLARQQNARPGAPAQTTVHDNAEDRPWGEGVDGSERFVAVYRFGEFLQAVRKANPSQDNVYDPRLRKHDLKDMKVRAAAGLNETIASDGGFLITQEIAPLMQKAAFDAAMVAPRANMIPLSGNSNGIKIPFVNETSRADGSRWGGILAYWQDEAQATTAKKPNFGKLELNLKKLMGLCYTTDELEQDAAALGTIISQGFSEEFAFKLDDACIRGNGAGTPLGILNAAATTSVAKETSQAAKTILYANVSKMRQRMLPRSFRNSVWFVNIDTLPQLEQLNIPIKNVAGTENVGGLPVWLPIGPNGSLTGGAAGESYGTLLGRPVIPIEQCETLGTVGDVILADMGWYAMITKGGVQAATSIHVNFLTDELAYRFILRTDGQPAIKSAITPYKGASGATLSPFVTLDTRA